MQNNIKKSIIKFLTKLFGKHYEGVIYLIITLLILLTIFILLDVYGLIYFTN